MHHGLHIGDHRGTAHALVLAAGGATRFGGGKLLAQWCGRPLMAGALEAAWAAPVTGVTLVTGCDAAGIRATAEQLARGRPLAVVEASAWRTGLSASLRAGLDALPSACARVFVFLGDMPRIPHDVAQRLCDALGEADAAAPVCAGVRGHPVLLTRRLFERVGELTGDRGAGALLARPDVAVARVPVDDDGVGFDVDTRAALASAH